MPQVKIWLTQDNTDSSHIILRLKIMASINLISFNSLMEKVMIYHTLNYTALRKTKLISNMMDFRKWHKLVSKKIVLNTPESMDSSQVKLSFSMINLSRVTSINKEKITWFNSLIRMTSSIQRSMDLPEVDSISNTMALPKWSNKMTT